MKAVRVELEGDERMKEGVLPEAFEEMPEGATRAWWDLSRTGQDVDFYELLLWDRGSRRRRRVEVRIRSNSYQSQCSASVRVWSADRGWLEVARLEPGAMQTPPSRYAHTDWDSALPFARDRALLLRLADAVLGEP